MPYCPKAALSGVAKIDLTFQTTFGRIAGMSKATDKLLKRYGNKKAIAEAMNVHEETVRLWLRDGIPLSKAIDVERDSEGAVTAEEILREAKAAA